MRDNYRKALKFRRCKNGDAAIKVKPYKFEVAMSFLKKYLPDRDQKTKITETLSAVNSPNTDDGEDDRMEDTNNLSDSGRVTPAPTATSASNNSTIFRSTPTLAAKTKKVQPQNTQPSSVASVLEKYLHTTTATGGNNLKQFFIAMSETAQSFPPELQIEVKGKIFNIIQEAELKCLQPRNTMQLGNVHLTGFHCSQNVHLQGPQYIQHSQDMQLSHPQYTQSSGRQPNITHLNLRHTQHSQDISTHSHPQNTLASQPQLTILQTMQPSIPQHIHQH